MIPLTIYLTPMTFNRLEKTAAKRGMRVRDMIAYGLEPKPVEHVVGYIHSPRRNGYTQLTADQWDEIQKLRSVGWTVPQLAVRFGCSSATIYKRLQKLTAA